MAELTDEQKTFIVQRLACFDSPQTVAGAVEEEFGFKIDRAHVYRYNPLRSGYDCGEKWRDIFEATRKAFLDDTSSSGIAHKAVRLRRLDDLCQRAIAMRNYALAAQLMEQAAKESGNAFTNKRELSGPNGAPVQTETVFRLEFVDGSADDDAPGAEGV